MLIFCSEKMDIISNLPNPLIAQILSFLPTKQAASTSVLSKRWRFLFASVTNLEFDDDEEEGSEEGFVNFVDRVMALQGNHTITRFSLNCHEYPDPVHVTAWVNNVLARGVSDFELSLTDYQLPSKIFVTKTLVKLKLEGSDLTIGADVGNVCLPKLKSLYLDSVGFIEDGVGLAKLLSGCPVLEELVLMNLGWENWGFGSVSVPTLKRLTIFSEEDYDFNNPKSLSFDTPNVVYLEYSDTIAGKYPGVNFDSLVEAHIGLRLSEDQSGEANFSEDEYNYYSDGEGDQEKMVGNVTDFLVGIRNVKILYLSAKAIEVLTFCCEVPPIFNNLTQLTIESNTEIGWKALPGFLKNCPNLETLVFKGLLHRSKKDECGNMCCCTSPKNPSYLSSSTVKVLKIIMTMRYDDEGMETEQIKHFLENMPCLEQLIVYYDISLNPSDFDLFKKLQNIPRIVSPKCNIQVISRNLNLSAIMPSSLSKKWFAPPSEEYAWFLNALA